ncbi:MAG: hypothetical protein HY537_06690 [Deltaproteobacteria bacterium]|nr:hypothetical protein [Deltaproteobacteria bacterium]
MNNLAAPIKSGVTNRAMEGVGRIQSFFLQMGQRLSVRFGAAVQTFHDVRDAEDRIETLRKNIQYPQLATEIKVAGFLVDRVHCAVVTLYEGEQFLRPSQNGSLEQVVPLQGGDETSTLEIRIDKDMAIVRPLKQPKGMAYCTNEQLWLAGRAWLLKVLPEGNRIYRSRFELPSKENNR